MPVSFTPTLPDPALEAHTFVRNPTLSRALARIAERAAVQPIPTLAPVISGAETLGDDAHDPYDSTNAPTENELDEHYLRVNDWQRQVLAGIGIVWSDPIGGGDYAFANALTLQAMRDRRDAAGSAIAALDE